MSSKPIDKSFIRLVPSDLDDFESPFSIVSNFERHKHLYFADKDFPSFSLHSFPDMCYVNVTSFQYHTNLFYGRKLGTNPILFYFLELGLNWLREQEEVTEAINLQRRFQHSIKSTSAKIMMVMGGFLGQIRLPFYSGGRRWNFPISPALFSTLTATSSELGVMKSNLASLCIMHALTESPHSNEDQVDEMQKIIDDFIDVLKIRNTGLEACLNAYEFPPLPEGLQL